MPILKIDFRVLYIVKKENLCYNGADKFFKEREFDRITLHKFLIFPIYTLKPLRHLRDEMTEGLRAEMKLKISENYFWKILSNSRY